MSNEKKLNTTINWKELQKLFIQGMIVVCPVCGKIDINPIKHKPVCNPHKERIMRNNQDYNWRN